MMDQRVIHRLGWVSDSLHTLSGRGVAVGSCMAFLGNEDRMAVCGHAHAHCRAAAKWKARTETDGGGCRLNDQNRHSQLDLSVAFTL